MSHRALLAGTSSAALYFDSLATAVDGEEAARAQSPSGREGSDPVVAPLLLEGAHGADDRRVVGEYLALLADNEKLPPGVRDVCRALQIPLRQ